MQAADEDEDYANCQVMVSNVTHPQPMMSQLRRDRESQFEGRDIRYETQNQGIGVQKMALTPRTVRSGQMYPVRREAARNMSPARGNTHREQALSWGCLASRD